MQQIWHNSNFQKTFKKSRKGIVFLNSGVLYKVKCCTKECHIKCLVTFWSMVRRDAVEREHGPMLTSGEKNSWRIGLLFTIHYKEYCEGWVVKKG